MMTLLCGPEAHRDLYAISHQESWPLGRMSVSGSEGAAALFNCCLLFHSLSARREEKAGAFAWTKACAESSRLLSPPRPCNHGPYDFESHQTERFPTCAKEQLEENGLAELQGSYKSCTSL